MSEINQLRTTIKRFCNASDNLRTMERVASDLDLANYIRSKTDELIEAYSEFLVQYIKFID